MENKKLNKLINLLKEFQQKNCVNQDEMDRVDDMINQVEFELK